MSGFVYIWYDRKHKRYYVGSHWGTEDDGYVCSSPWMNRAYRLRSSDFKRRIIEQVHTSREDLLSAEGRWLSKIKKEELRTRYYNLHNHEPGHWTVTKDDRSIRQKISASSKGKIVITDGVRESRVWPYEQIPEGWYRGHGPRKSRKPVTEETRQRMREGARNRKKYYGRVFSEETKKKIGDSNRGRKRGHRSDKDKARISAKLTGRTISDETRAKCALIHKGKIRSEETRQKLRDSHLGKKQSEETKKKRSEALKLYWNNKRCHTNT